MCEVLIEHLLWCSMLIACSLDEIDKTYQSIANLGVKLKALQEENSRHGQVVCCVNSFNSRHGQVICCVIFFSLSCYLVSLCPRVWNA